MPTRLYEGPSIEALIEQVRADVGKDARIVRAQKVRKGGILGFFAREVYELIVEVPGGRRGTGTSGDTVREPTRRSSRPFRAVSARRSGGAQRTGVPPRAAGMGQTKIPLGRETPRTEPDLPSASVPSGVTSSGRATGIDALVRQRYGSLSGATESADPTVSVTPDAESADPTVSVTPDAESADPTVSVTPADGAAESQGTRPKFAETASAGSSPGALTKPLPKESAGSTGSSPGALTKPLPKESAGSTGNGYWSFFLVPGRSERIPPHQPPRLAPSFEVTYPTPSTESAAFAGLVEALSDAGRALSARGSGTSPPIAHVSSDQNGGNPLSPSQSGRSGMLESAPLPSVANDYLEDLRIMDSDEQVMVGEVPVLPPEVLRILNRIPIAGILPPGAGRSMARDDPVQDGRQKYAPWYAWGRWVPTAAAWGSALAPTTHGDIFASSPLLPTGLSAIGFPAALLPTKEVSELASRLAEPDVDFESTDLAKGLFIEALRELPPPPELPTEPGMLLAVVGDLAQARKLAARLAADRGVDPAEIVVAAPDGHHDDVPAWMVIESEEVAAKRRPRWRDKGDVTLVAVAAPLTDPDRRWARGVLDALQPDLICGVVEATHKPEDIAAWAIDLGRVDTLALEGGRATRTPAAILACGIPVAMIDGQEADTELWASIVEERLATV